MGDRMNGLARLGEEVRRDLEETRTAVGGASRVRAKLVSRAAAPPVTRQKPRLRWGRIAGALAMVAMMVFGISFAASRAIAKRELTFAVAETENGVVGAFIAAPTGKELPLAFSDGTRVVLAPSTRARVASVTPTGARILVESGKLHADVVHTGEAKWAVEAGPFEVRVTGTSFDVTWDPKDESIAVALTEGSVVVTGCTLGEGKRVVRGEELRVSCKGPEIATTGAPAAIPPPALTPEGLPDAPPATASARPIAVASASAAPAAAPAPAPAPAPAKAAEPTAAELLAAADAARYEGDFDRAIESLNTVRRRFAGTDAAASAAFELGRITFDTRRDFARAGDWFDTYLRERPNGPYAREALGRALEARNRAGDATQAEHLAVRYLTAYPDGPHAKLARRIAQPANQNR
jgi:transmembrane sensor